MTSEMNGTPRVFMLDDFDSALTATMPIIPEGHNEAIGSITFAGPGHEKTVQQQDRLNRENIAKGAEREAMTASGKRWVPAKETPADMRARSVAYVVQRIVDIDLNVRGPDGQPQKMQLSSDMMTALLNDPNKGWLFNQCWDFLFDVRSFTKSSVQT